MTKDEMKLYITNLYPKVTNQLDLQAPKLQFTRGRKFWGRIRKNINGPFIDIRINIEAFYSYFHDNDEAFKDKVLGTICHELAHMVYWNHGERHTTLTEKYRNKVTIISTPEVINKVTLNDMVSDTKKARNILRKNNIQKPSTKWEWDMVPNEIIELLKGI